MDWLCGSLVYLDAHLHRPEWRGEDLGLLTKQGTLTALRIGEGESGAKGREREVRRRWKFFNK